MSKILQGTTPTANFHIKPEDLDISLVTDLKLVFLQESKQFGVYKIRKRLADCDIFPEQNMVSYHFTEDETMGFVPKQSVIYQFMFEVNEEKLGTVAKRIDIEGWIDSEVTFDDRPYRRNNNCC